MHYSSYIFTFLVSFLIAVALLIVLVSTRKFFADRRRGSRHIHRRGISRFGGVAIVTAFIVTLWLIPNFFISQELMAILLASVFILIIGVLDDWREINWKFQLFFQIFIITFIYIAGIRVEYITNPFGGIIELGSESLFLPSLLFSIVWVVILMNSMNWADGIDGLSGGITLIGAVTILFLSLKPEVNQPSVAIICSALIGAVLAFLIFNFYPAKILAGSSGSMFMGFILASLAIFAGTKIATTLLVVMLPVIDFCCVIVERVRDGQSIFSPDRRHLHYKLSDLGWSQKKICLFFYSLTIIIALVAFNTRAIGKLTTIISVTLVILVSFYFINKRVYAKEGSKYVKK